jgi:hypothetical protein
VGNDLHFRMVLDEQRDGKQPDSRQKEVLRCLRFVAHDVWNIETLLDRINWQCELWSANQMTDGRWNVYITADIDLFHVEFRSLFDYLARLIRALANKPGQVPEEASFEKLTNWVVKPENTAQQRLGEELVKVVTAADWFPLIRQVRNDLVHRGAETLVFYDKPRVLFQTYTGGREKIIDIPELMHNPNVVDFERYAAVFYGYLIDYLEEVASVVYLRLGLKRREGGSRHHNPGIATAKRWMESAILKFRQ